MSKAATKKVKNFKKVLGKSPGKCYYNTRKRKKGDPKMSYNFYEVHAAEWEAAQEFWAEEEALAQMDADYEASGGHLWD